jgi:glucokinase
LPLVAGVDLGGTVVNYTLWGEQEQFLIQGLCEYPSRSREGPEVCLQQIVDGLEIAVEQAGVRLADVAVVGLDTPGPASAEGVLSARVLRTLCTGTGQDSTSVEILRTSSASR